jgi:integrase/recombinase XerD
MYDEKSFALWLEAQGLAPSTVKRYLWELDRFAENHRGPQGASHADLTDWLAGRRKSGDAKTALAALKAYYRHLQETGQRDGSPIAGLKLRDHRSKKGIHLGGLLAKEELQGLLGRPSRYALLHRRDQLALGLYAHQGLATGELAALNVRDIDLQKGTVHVAASRQRDGRSLELRASQMPNIMGYLLEDRPKLLKTDSDRLIISKLGNAESGDNLHYLISKLAHLVPNKKLTPVTVRQSVIANWLKEGKDLETVRRMAGHRHISSTEAYRQEGLEALRDATRRFHPLG